MVRKFITGILTCLVLFGSFIEPTLAFGVSASLASGDPGFTQSDQNIDRQWGLVRAKFIDAWNTTTGSLNVVVAVIDTGVDETHEDLVHSSFVPGYNFIDGTPIVIGQNSDDNGHGTLVAGVLGATANNGVGVVGNNWKVSLMPLKALDASGNGTSEHVAEAIKWATDHGASIINLSLGGVGFGQDLGLANSITYAYRHNVVIVAAAGNDTALVGKDLDNDPVFPICDDNGENMILGVTALDSNDQKPGFANYGKSCVDVSAPGKRILSTIGRDPITRALSPNSYAYASGTSLAVPFVSGLAALIKSLYPEATNRQIRDQIITTTDYIDPSNTSQCSGSCQGKLGSGRINAVASLAKKILPEQVTDGEVVQIAESGEVFVISGGKRLLLSSFVHEQRFGGIAPKIVYLSQVSHFPVGQYAPPADGTLVKKASDPTVYWIVNGLKMPISGQVFLDRGLRFDRVSTLSDAELNSWLTGQFLPPADGALVRARKNPTIYWVVGGSLHPISANFYESRGLSIFKLTITSDQDIKQFPKGAPYL